MKREQFLITSTVGHNITKYKWNSASREVQRLIQEHANNNGDTWTLIESASEKETYYFVSGTRVWQSDKGEKITFYITKIA